MVFGAALHMLGNEYLVGCRSYCSLACQSETVTVLSCFKLQLESADPPRCAPVRYTHIGISRPEW